MMKMNSSPSGRYLLALQALLSARGEHLPLEAQQFQNRMREHHLPEPRLSEKLTALKADKDLLRRLKRPALRKLPRLLPRDDESLDTLQWEIIENPSIAFIAI